jgi:MYXO-CTERM domain-containing protein
MDVSAAITEIQAGSAAAASVGGAVLAVLGVILAFRIIRRAF